MAKTLSRINKLVSECLAIEAESAKDAGMLSYMARSMVIATLPHSKPKNNIFQRKNGNHILTMIGNPTFGLPYGSYPRLLMAWITREAILKKSPVLQLGRSFSSFLKTLNLTQRGGVRGDASRMKEQMLKLFATQVSCINNDSKKGFCKADQFMISRSFELWWNPLKDGEFSQQSTIILTEDFFNELIDRPVPIDIRMYNALRRSPLQMDVYAWLTYRFSYLKKSSLIMWDQLSGQFGSNYADNGQGVRDFKREFLKALHLVTAMYKEANIEVQDEGIILKKSRPHVLQKTLIGVYNP